MVDNQARIGMYSLRATLLGALIGLGALTACGSGEPRLIAPTAPSADAGDAHDTAAGDTADSADATASSCGDAVCQTDESCSSCSVDCGECPPSCGNATCDGGETCWNCGSDCGACPAACGDGVCSDAETCSDCALDCGACPSVCGDGTCTSDETCSSCEPDCGACAPSCGDGACSDSETCSSCPGDCGVCPPACGNGACNSGEACSTCAVDCGACPPACGDGACDAGETCASCAMDCGVCPPACGDGVCNGDETCASCSGDCGPCAPTCGDSSCNGEETCTTCAADCGACLPSCGDNVCNDGETCANCARDCGGCTITHETEFLTWNLYNDAGCRSSNGVAKWSDRDDGPGSLSIRQTLVTQDPAILALQEDGKLGPASCSMGSVKNKVAGWLAGTHDVRSTDDVSGGASGERLAIFIKRSKYRFITAGYHPCTYNGAEVRGFMWAEVDLIADNTSNHFYVLNAHFKARSTAADVAERMAQAQCVTDWVNARRATNPYRAHFLLGDLNSGPDHNNDAYAMLTGPNGLFENTSTAGTNAIDTHGSHWIDHVLGTKGSFTSGGYGSWTVGAGQVQAGGKLSDHLGLRTRIGHLR